MMMIDQAYIAYFEHLATTHQALRHRVSEKRKSFFVIANAYDLTEFDNAVQNNPCAYVLLVDTPTGYISDNGASNYTQMTKIDFMVVGKATLESLQQVRSACFQIGMDIICQFRSDQQKKAIIPGRQVYLQEGSIPYEILGPVQDSHYGYSFSLSICCPFHWELNEGSWADKQ